MRARPRSSLIDRLHLWLTPIGFLIAIVAVWEVFVRVTDTPSYLLPAPSEIGLAFLDNFANLLFHTAITGVESLLGFVVANLSGFCVGAAFAHSRTLEKGLYPYAIALKTTPVIAMAPLLVVWLGTGIGSKVATSALVCFFPILVGSVKGLRSVDEEALSLFASLNATRWQVFSKLRLPSSLPFVFSALRISSSLSVVGAIVGEFVGANQGLGYVVLVSSYHLETATMFAATALAALWGVSLFGIVSLIEAKAVFWQERIE